MSGVQAPHLQRREGIYYLRVRVPDAVRPLVGKTEIVRSLRTGLLREARPRAALLTALVMEAFDVIKTTVMTAAEARNLIQRSFVEIISEQERVGGYIPHTADPDMEIGEQKHLSEERVTSLREQLDLNRFDGEVKQRVRALVQQQGFASNQVSEARFADLSNGVAQILIEQQRLFQLRMEDRLAPYIPANALFLSSETADQPIPQMQAHPVPVFKGPSLGQSVEKFLDTHKAVWKHKTYKARCWQLGYLVEHIGASRPVASITPSDIRDYRDAVLTLRANHGYTASQTFAAKQTDNVGARIKPKTADLIFQPVKTFFKWAVSAEGLIESSPARDIKIVVLKGKKEEPSRRPFEPDEIVTLFSMPLFNGCKSVHRRYLPGEKVIRDGKYWLPILGYYTGCRLGELVQLAIEDVRLVDDAYYLDLNEKELLGSDEKSVKTTAGIRRVPLHPDLIKLGFPEFVTKRAKQDKSNVRLFKEIKFGVDGQASTEYSKIFARLLDKAGLTDPNLVFHSWRHGAEDAFRDAGIQPYITDTIIGHADNTMGGKYGKGVSLKVLTDAVAAMQLPVRLPDVIKSK